MTAIAFDPGLSTGVAIHTDERYVTTVIKDTTQLWEIIDHHNPRDIIVENFQAGGLISSAGQATLRLIGALEVICYRHEIHFILQFPGEIHNDGPWKPNAKLMLKQIKKTPIVHEIDALAHLLLYEHRLNSGVLDKIMRGRRGYMQLWN